MTGRIREALLLLFVLATITYGQLPKLVCSNCGNEAPMGSTAGGTCRHCGVMWRDPKYLKRREENLKPMSPPEMLLATLSANLGNLMCCGGILVGMGLCAGGVAGTVYLVKRFVIQKPAQQ